MHSLNADNDLKKILDKSFSIKNFAIFLAAAIFVCFPTVLTLQATFMHRDYSAFGYPLAAYNRDCFWHGEIPLWNPYNACGIPYLAQWNTIFLYPPSLFYMIFPTQWSLGIFNILHMYFAGIGMYLLVKKWTKNNFAAAVGGISFSFSGLIQYSLMWPNDIATMSWMPWLVLAVENAIKNWGKWVLIAIIVGTLQMLSGFPEGIALTWLLIGILAIFVWAPEIIKENSLFNLNTGLNHEEDENPRYKLFKQTILRLGIVFISIILLCSIQLFPFFDLLIHSHRNPEYGQSYWAMPWFGWANLILPLFYCFPASDFVFHQYDQQWTGSYYSGIAVFVLAFTALFKIRERIVGVLSIMLAFSLVLALGDDGFLYKWIRTGFPFLGFMRFPVKFVVITTFILPILSAYGIKYLFDKPDLLRKTIISISAIIFMAICFLCFIQYKYPKIYDIPKTVIINGACRVILLALTVFFLFEIIKTTKHKWIPWFVLFLFFADLAYHSPKMNPVVRKEVYDPDMTIFANNPPCLGFNRAMIDPKMMDLFKFQAVMLRTNTAAEPLFRKKYLAANCNLLLKIPKLDGMYSLYPKDIANLINALYYTRLNHNIPESSLNFLSISHILPTNSTAWVLRTNFLPYITGGQKPIYIDSKKSKMDSILLFDLSYDKNLFIPNEAWTNGIAREPSNPKITQKKYEHHYIEFSVESEKPSWIVISQTYHTLWKAFLNKKRIQVWKVNVAFTGLESSSGKNTIILKYDDIYFKIGFFISFCALTLVFSHCLLVRRSMNC